MTEESGSVKKINMTNTKKEMVEAYNKLVAQLQKKKEERLSPQEKKEEKRNKEIVKIVDSLSSEGVIKNIGELKGEIGNLLLRISGKLEDEIGKYVKIKEAIMLKEAEFQELYDIEKNAQTLAALIEAQNLKREEFEKEIRDKKAAFESEMKQTYDNWEKEKKAREIQLKEEEEATERKRRREREEYEYSIKRQNNIDKDKLEDERAKLKKEMEIYKAETEENLARREAEIEAKEDELASLRDKVNSFPNEMKVALDKAAKELTDKFKNESKRNEELREKIFDGERQVLNTKIEALTQMVEEQNKQILRLSQQLDGAYQKIQNIAVKTVGGISSEKETSAVGAEAKK